jgi:mRNA interferase RelE/StbE
MPTLDLARDAAKFLERLPAKQFRQVVVRVLDLMREPRPPDSQQLRGYPFLRIDVGEYRVIYDIEGPVVRILVIGKRNDDEVYRRLRRKEG